MITVWWKAIKCYVSLIPGSGGMPRCRSVCSRPAGKSDQQSTMVRYLVRRRTRQNKETSRLPISRPFVNIVCLKATWYLCHATWLVSQYHHSRVSMVVADGLAPTWRQDICNHHDDKAWSAYIRCAPRDAVYPMEYAHGFVVVCFVVVLILCGYFWSVYKYSSRLL